MDRSSALDVSHTITFRIDLDLDTDAIEALLNDTGDQLEMLVHP